MKKLNYFKKTLLLLAGLGMLSALANAEVIDLDNKNLQNCQKQILASKDAHPVVLDYSPDCPFSQQFMPTYLKVAAQTPDRVFFRIDLWTSSDEVRNKCLDENVDNGRMYPVPTTKLMEIKVDPTTKQKQIVETSRITGQISEDELVNFIKVNHKYTYQFSLPNKLQ